MLSRNLTVHQYTGTSMSQIERALRWWARVPGVDIPNYSDSDVLTNRIKVGKIELNNNSTNEWLYDYDLMREILIHIIRFPTIALHENLLIREWYQWAHGVPFAGVSKLAGRHTCCTYK